MKSCRIDRRDFLRAGAAGIAVGYFVNPLAAEPSKSPNERIRIAAVGCTNRAADDLNGVASQDIIAIADIDEQELSKVLHIGNRHEAIKLAVDMFVERLISDKNRQEDPPSFWFVVIPEFVYELGRPLSSVKATERIAGSVLLKAAYSADVGR